MVNSQASSNSAERVGVVIIGRNEGDRLVRCLESLPEDVARAVYVDSGSTDDSVAAAERAGAVVVHLDLDRPFTAARARDEGLSELLSLVPECEYVFFVDGDCEICGGWIAAAVQTLDDREELAAVCGRIVEKHPDRSVYNELMQLEWDRPPGDTESCPGISVMRISAYQQVGGFDHAVIAGEEPELCLRLRREGWKITRIAEAMVRHDAAILRFGQWWRRCVRGGYAAALGFAMHGSGPERFNAARVRRPLIWAVAVPLLTILGGLLSGWGWLLAMVYPLQLARLGRSSVKAHGFRLGLLSSLSQMLDKFPQAQGILTFGWRRLTGGSDRIIEYKSSSTPQAIVYLAPLLPAKSETFVYREVRALRARGHRVVVVSLRAPGAEHDAAAPELAEGRILVYGSAVAFLADLARAKLSPIRWLRTIGLGVIDAMTPAEPMSPASRVKIVVQSIAGAVLAVRLRRAGVTPSVLHAHFAHAPAAIAMYAAVYLGRPFTFTGHANDLFQRRSLLAKKLRRAAGVSCISHWHRELYQSISPDQEDRYTVIRCGVDTEAWAPSESEPDRSDTGTGPLRVLSVGRFVEKKGFDLLVSAVGKLAAEGIPIRATVLGDGPERERLERVKSQHDPRDAVSLPGSADNESVRAAMTEAEIFLLPCREDSNGDRDGLPVVLLEAMASGLGVIVGDLPAIRELVEHGVTGCLIQTEDDSEAIATLRTLASERDSLDTMIRSGRSRVIQEFSQHVNVARLEEMFGLEPLGLVQAEPSEADQSRAEFTANT